MIATRDVIVWGLFVAVIFVLTRVIWGTPLVTRVRETFASGGGTKKLVNTATTCPEGSTMYMYNGVAHCCSGVVNTDADTAVQSCIAPSPGSLGGPAFVFCSLGPPSEGVTNCVDTRAGLLAVTGAKMCPTATPNYVQGGPSSATSNGRCCASAGNEELTDCTDVTQPYCDVTTAKNIFTVPTSCQYQRVVQGMGTCPQDYSQSSVTGAGSMTGMTLPACSNASNNCYLTSVVKRLNELGLDTSGLPPCPVNSGPT